MSILEKFKSDNNILNLSSLIKKEIRYDVDNEQLVIFIKEYSNNWISLGKFDKFEKYYPSLLDYYNKLFIQTFKNNIMEKLSKTEFEFNPFRDTINSKKMADFDVNDYRNMYVQANEEYNPMLNRSNAIPYYKKQIHHRHYDATDIGGLYLSGNDEEVMQYKRNSMNFK